MARSEQKGEAESPDSSTPQAAGGVRYERSSRSSHRAGTAEDAFTYIGKGEPGGKAAGLALIKASLDRAFPGGVFQDIRISIPRMTVLLTGVFEQFMALNNLYEVARSDLEDERIAHVFQKAELPPTVVGDLLSLISGIHEPLAVRSSSLLEDSLYQPFAGVYETKMIPNNQPDPESRFRRLVEAIKVVYASTYFRAARQYFSAVGADIGKERMGVIIQEVVGYRFAERYYPTISGVARSYNFYPAGNADPRDGVVNLALGLGKTIVDGGRVWSYSPALPRARPPYGSTTDLLKATQTRFWSVFMGTPKEYDPIRETEYLYEGSLTEAEDDGALQYICSTYDAASDRLRMGSSGVGPRLVDFSPLLQGRIAPLNELLEKLLELAEKEVGEEVEIEFALAFDPHRKRESRFGFLQLRPMVVASRGAIVDLGDFDRQKVLIYSQRAMGNGVLDNLRDILYLRPETFRAEHTQQIATEVERLNSSLLEAATPYVLIGFGRWGSADPWLGVPVRWVQISGARVIVETTVEQMSPDLSQGSHFFHNMTSLGVLYLSVPDPKDFPIDWAWLQGQPVVRETEHLRHVRAVTPLTVRVDGRSGKGLILK
jgi:hypothetical protein